MKDRRREFDEVQERWRETRGRKTSRSDGVELERARQMAKVMGEYCRHE